MQPVLRHGQIVFAHRLRSPKENDVVIATLKDREIIKRISLIDGEKVFLLGDNSSSSTDSRQFGWVDLDKIKSIVWVRK